MIDFTSVDKFSGLDTDVTLSVISREQNLDNICSAGT